MKETIVAHIEQSISVKNQMLCDDNLIEQIAQSASIITKAYRENKKTLLAGNGGSAGDAQHIAGEFVSRFYFDRPGLPSVSLTTDSSILTAISNDYGYEKVFSRQIEAQALHGDVFIGISTSGNSENILQALHTCKKLGVVSIAFTGATGGKIQEACDICIKVPSDDTPRIQEAHILIGHIICSIVEENLFGKIKI